MKAAGRRNNREGVIMRMSALVAGVLAGIGLIAAPGYTDSVTRRAAAPTGTLATALDRLLAVEKAALHHSPPVGLQPATPEPARRKTTRSSDGGSTAVGDLETLPPASGGAQWRCLTEAVYHEARGESVQGQFAIAEVVLNRVALPSFPDNVCDVVRQRSSRHAGCQFSFVCDSRPNSIGEPVAWERAGKVARLVLDGHAPSQLTLGATHFHTAQVKPRWAQVFPRTTRIGTHLFYRDPKAQPLQVAAPEHASRPAGWPGVRRKAESFDPAKSGRFMPIPTTVAAAR